MLEMELSMKSGQWIVAQAQIDSLPIFLREGKQSYLIHEV